MARTYHPKANLRSLEYSPAVNPLMEPQAVQVKQRHVRTGRSEELINVKTGEIAGVAAIYQIEERDDAGFVKVFSEGIKKAYELTGTGYRVFQAVLEVYEKSPMRSGYAESVRLYWFGDGLEGRDVGMSEYTWRRGLRELIDKRFLSPRDPASFWVNPALFFKGDRVLFVKEYRRQSRQISIETAPTLAVVETWPEPLTDEEFEAGKPCPICAAGWEPGGKPDDGSYETVTLETMWDGLDEDD